MKIIKINLPAELEQLELHIFADEHIGDEHCDMKRLLERIEYVKNTPYAYCILNGDLLDNATKTSIGDSYAQAFNPMEQLEKAVELFGPIKDKVICITHAAQIASLADTHLFIEKNEVDGRMETSVRTLDDAGRVDEIARILGGLEVTEAQRRAAEDMIKEKASI